MMTQQDLYEYHSIEQVYTAMESLRETDPEMFINYTLKELIDDAVTAGLMSVELGRDYLKAYSKQF